MSNVAKQLTSLGGFLAWECDQSERYEYAGGVITMMTEDRRHMARSR
jgi:hypothetical protein